MKNVSDFSFDRKKAVRRSAEILRDAGAAFFPLDIQKFLKPFRSQILLTTYEAAKSSGDEKALSILRSGPALMSKDGFCTRINDVLVRIKNAVNEGTIWNIYYDEKKLPARIRFTLTHELGHIFLGHHQEFGVDTLVGLEDNPDYKAADTEADCFSINLLAPAPAAYRLLTAHGYTFSADQFPHWQLTNPKAPFLIHLGSNSSLPDPEELLMTAFDISRTAACRRLNELPLELDIWQELDSDLYSFIEKIPHHAGWYCQVCNYRRRINFLYCPKCGHWKHYDYKVEEKASRPLMPLRKNGQFSFCSVCGNSEFPEDAEYCPICGCPVINECENSYWTIGDFIRHGKEVVQGTHRCRPTDIYCGQCGVITAFGRNYGPKKNMWTSNPGSDYCRMSQTTYPDVFPAGESRLRKCPLCGSEKTIRDGRYCAKCMLPMENHCISEGKTVHACAPNDRYCRICGSPTNFQKLGLFPDYRESEEYKRLIESEKHPAKPPVPLLLIQQDGIVRNAIQE